LLTLVCQASKNKEGVELLASPGLPRSHSNAFDQSLPPSARKKGQSIQLAAALQVLGDFIQTPELLL